MNKDLQFNSNTLEYSDAGNKRYLKDGQEYTLKSILTDFKCDEILRLKLGTDTLVFYNHTFRASRNMYFSFYSCVKGKTEIASAVVAHLIRTWKNARSIEKVNVYASYSQNKFDVQMLTLCLNDTITPSNINSLYSEQPFSILVRLHSNLPGAGSTLATVVMDDVSRFRTHPSYLWLEASGYSKYMIDNHLGLLVEPTGKSDKLDLYYKKLGFTVFDTSTLDKGNPNITLRDRFSHSMYIDLHSDIVRNYSSLITRHRLKEANTVLRKHISNEDKRHLLANISEE